MKNRVSPESLRVAQNIVDAYTAGIMERDDLKPAEILVSMIAKALDERFSDGRKCGLCGGHTVCASER